MLFHVDCSNLDYDVLLLQLPTLWVVASLVPIVGGVALASVTEASFNWLENAYANTYI